MLEFFLPVQMRSVAKRLGVRKSGRTKRTSDVTAAAGKIAWVVLRSCRAVRPRPANECVI